MPEKTKLSFNLGRPNVKLLRVSLLVAVGCFVVQADESPMQKTSGDLDATCKRADDAYAEAIKRAEAALEKARKEAMAMRLKTYKDRLAKTTQAGDFDRASVIKAAIETMENPRSPIPKDAVKFNGHHYQVIREPATWHTAKKRCEKLGGHLVCIETPEEEAFVIEYLKSQAVTAWIGANDEEAEGRWQWVNGKDARLTNASLDNLGGYEHAINWSRESARWNDASLGDRLAFLCEWDR